MEALFSGLELIVFQLCAGDLLEGKWIVVIKPVFCGIVADCKVLGHGNGIERRRVRGLPVARAVLWFQCLDAILLIVGCLVWC
jgi:hypothetical protein